MDRRSLLDRWIGRPAPPTAPWPGLASALADLERLGVDRTELLGPARMLGALLAAAFGDVEPDPPAGPGLDALLEGWSEGIPAFRVAPPVLDGERLLGRLRRVVAASVDSSGAFAGALKARKVDVLGWAASALAGRPEEIAYKAEAIGVDPGLAASCLRLTLLPTLSRVAAGLDRLRPDGAWPRGICPNCGSPPLLAESRGLEQRIFFRCGLCAGDWAGERLRCPSCGESDAKARHYSYVEGEQDRCRLAHCDACRYDWKVVSTLTALTSPAMIVADLATVHLDLIAADRQAQAS